MIKWRWKVAVYFFSVMRDTTSVFVWAFLIKAKFILNCPDFVLLQHSRQLTVDYRMWFSWDEKGVTWTTRSELMNKEHPALSVAEKTGAQKSPWLIWLRAAVVYSRCEFVRLPEVVCSRLLLLLLFVVVVVVTLIYNHLDTHKCRLLTFSLESFSSTCVAPLLSIVCEWKCPQCQQSEKRFSATISQQVSENSSQVWELFWTPTKAATATIIAPPSFLPSLALNTHIGRNFTCGQM